MTKILSGSVGYWENEPDVNELQRAIDMLELDPVEGVKMLEELAELGSIQSMLQLGYAYGHGSGIKRDTSRGEQWYRRAADSGSNDAAYRLALIYRYQGK